LILIKVLFFFFLYFHSLLFLFIKLIEKNLKIIVFVVEMNPLTSASSTTDEQ